LIADAEDDLVGALRSEAETAGWRVERLTIEEAAGRFTIRRDGQGVTVDPPLPIFLRPPRAASPWLDGEAQFHHAERCGLVWAAAALTPAPVVNRPGPHGFVGLFSPSGAVLRARAGVAANGEEVYSCRLPVQASSAGWWVESQRDRSAAPLGAHDADGPFRSGPVPSGVSVAMTAVVGARAWPVTGRTRRLLSASVDVCRRLGLGFGTVTWRLAEQGAPFLVRVNPRPALLEVGDAWPSVASALLEDLGRT
jgi:hypothetical protein